MNREMKLSEFYLFVLIIFVPFTAILINRHLIIQLLFLLYVIVLFFLIRGFSNFHQYKNNILIFILYMSGLIYLFYYKTGYFSFFLKEFYYINLLILLYWVFNYFFIYQKRKIRILKLMVVLGTIVSLYCFFEYILQRNLFFQNYFSYKNEIDGFNPYYRVSGTLYHPIPMSTFSMVIMYISYYLGQHEKKIKYYIYSFINLGAVFLTFSRSTLIAIAASFFIYKLIIGACSIIKNREMSISKSVFKLLRFTIIITITFCLVNYIKIGGNSIYELIVNRFLAITTTEDSGSFYQRYYGMEFVIDEMVNNSNPIKFLFGNGYGRLTYNLESMGTTIYGDNFYLIDNQYFTLLYNIGFVGVLLIGLIVVYRIFTHIKKIYLNSQDVKRDIIPFICLISILIHLFFYEGLTYITTTFTLSFTLSLCSLIHGTSKSK
ncbi:hypothetical protein [Peribacillus sp. NPDC097295]|uniref:hypothetical protein n=1 Tax=Peribacillus sp. NPDC097295 TaxID=3364402 RepID=UPI00380CD44A